MKRMVVFLTLAVIACSFTSCVREYSCTCIRYNDDYDEIIGIQARTKKEARVLCDRYDEAQVACEVE